MLFMLSILFWIVTLMFNFSYLFSVLFLVFLVFWMMLVIFSGVMYIKYLVVLVYISGVVIFMLYISCLCWYASGGFSYYFLFFSIFLIYLCDYGVMSNFSDIGEYLWMFLFFAFLFNSLVSNYSLVLFKISGSLRF